MTTRKPLTRATTGCAIAVMAKASVPGLTKTRLTPQLTGEEAAALNSAFLKDVVAGIRRAARHTPISPWLAYMPAGSEKFFRDLLGHQVGLYECVDRNLGHCLRRTVDELLTTGYDSACVLNSDSPTLPTAYLVTAATILSAPGDRGVIGPSIDGGYYLLGLKRAHARLFEDIDWSTERVFAQTMARAGEIGLEMVTLPDWYDVDDMASLDILMREVLAGEPYCAVAAGRPRCEATRRLLSQWSATGRFAAAPSSRVA